MSYDFGSIIPPNGFISHMGYTTIHTHPSLCTHTSSINTITILTTVIGAFISVDTESTNRHRTSNKTEVWGWDLHPFTVVNTIYSNIWIENDINLGLYWIISGYKWHISSISGRIKRNSCISYRECCIYRCSCVSSWNCWVRSRKSGIWSR